MSRLLHILFAATMPITFGQVDAFTLRAKYGEPLNRETFAVRPGIRIVVDYRPAKQACRVRIPSGNQIRNGFRGGAQAAGRSSAQRDSIACG